MDKKRILSKFEEMKKYLEELDEIKPSDFDEYKNLIEKKRACERLLQMIIESVIDVCNIITSDLRLGIPADEEDMFSKLEKKAIITKDTKKILTNMKGMRNVLVHKYEIIKDELVFEVISEKLSDFEKFKTEILKFLKGKK
ncbi:MAG: DUF86 domain-containing protein [Candidatus Pacearchaeota archaeon]